MCENKNVQSRAEIIAKSLHDEFVYSGPDYPEKGEPDGFIWGVRYSNAYPGLTYVEGGERAKHWSEKMDRKMHEITLETQAFHFHSPGLKHSPSGEKL